MCHHPGPPRFASVGETVALAPCDPDPGATYRWSLAAAPAGSELSLDRTPVVRVTPDEPGTYRFRLRTPETEHSLSLRAFPDERRDATFELSTGDLPIPPDDVERLSVVGPFNDFRLGHDRPRETDDGYALSVRLPPGRHPYGFAVNDDLSKQVGGGLVVPGAGRPRVRLDASVGADAVELSATASSPPRGYGGGHASKRSDDATDAGGDADASDDVTVEFHLDGRDSLRRESVCVGDSTLTVPRGSLPEGTVRIHAVAHGARRSVADTLRLDVVADAVTVERPAAPPAWVRSATVYEIFVRSFAGETRDATFRDLTRRVPYLDWLGVDCVWLTPVVEGPTRHGYHVTDYFRTASDLGSRVAFEEFVHRCHDAGIRVVFDLVANHTSRDHPAFHLHSAGVDGYADRYRRTTDTVEDGVDWAGPSRPEYYFDWQHIPNLNYDSLAVRRWMLDVVDAWADLVDGFRCDIAWGVPHGFWKEVRVRVKARDTDFLLLDEVLPRRAAFAENEFDLHHDSKLYHALRAVGRGDTPADAIRNTFADARRAGFPADATFLRYVENHDETRYLSECGDAALRAATAATFTLPGAPMVYYGQERGMTARRGPMRWWDGDDGLTAFVRSLSRLRDGHPALRVGSVDPVRYHAPTDGVTAFARETDGERLVAVLNFDRRSRRVALDADVDATDLRTGENCAADDGVTVDSVGVFESKRP